LTFVHKQRGHCGRRAACCASTTLPCIRGSRQTLGAEEVSRIAAPVLVAVGAKDPIAGSAHELAALLPHGRALDIPNRDHMLSVGDKVFKAGVLEFLTARP
jgi:pimeloyl-ACP methyl ester carboxylesterase